MPETTTNNASTTNDTKKDEKPGIFKRAVAWISLTGEQIQITREKAILKSLTGAVDKIQGARAGLQTKAADLKKDEKSSIVDKATNAIYRFGTCVAEYAVKAVRWVAFRVYQAISKVYNWVKGLFSKKADAPASAQAPTAAVAS